MRIEGPYRKLRFPNPNFKDLEANAVKMRKSKYLDVYRNSNSNSSSNFGNTGV